MTLHSTHTKNQSSSHPDSQLDALADFIESIDAPDAGVDLLVEVLVRRSQALAPALDAVVNAQRSLDALRPALASLPDAVTPELAQGAMATENAWRFPSGYPDGDRPADRLQDAEAVLAAAQGHLGVEW